MRIGLDVSQTGDFKTGCGYFADSLVRHLVAIDRTNSYILYPTFGPGYWDPRWATNTLDLTDQPRVQRGLGHHRLDQLEGFWLDPPADLEAQLGSPDIIHSNNFYCPTGLKTARLVYTLHDLVFASHPEWTTEANWRNCFDGVFNASVYADRIVAVSAYTRAQFLSTFPHYPPHRINVVYEASRFDKPHNGPPPRSVAHLAAQQFWLAGGSTEPRKNLTRLLEAFARLTAAGETRHPLVLFGGTGPQHDDLELTINRLGLANHVHRLGYVDDTALRWLYEHCLAFCYPSLYEGFGLPVVEALSLGAAVLTSNATSLPEVVGDVGILVDPFDVDAISAGLRTLASDASTLAGLRSRARGQASRFSWQRAATQIDDMYREVVAQPSPASERKR
ncbi:MAG TPA: glycosyltransferase family 1 protein [Chloroflexota bacterium]|nr:glycosyltransferase family 1 protein [Chloroflexota bacterium]